MNLRVRGWIKPVVALLATTTLVGGLSVAESVAQTPTDCPEIMTTDQLQKGMIATGYTVAEGRTVETFQAEILGVLTNGLGPGRDLIVADLSGGPTAGRGPWFGISGSPVYFGDKFVGSTSYGFSGGSSLAGLTAAEDIMALFDYSSGSSASAQARYSPREVEVSRSMARTIRTSTGESAHADSTFRQLKIPLAISGLNPRRMSEFAERLDQQGLPFVPFAASGASAAATTTTTGSFQRGDNLVAGLSYGDVTNGALGTATVACDGMVVAFGHPFFWDGETTYGANAADSITVVDDPVFGSYELATIGEGVGTIDQDRLAGIRGITGAFPSLVPITSSVSVPELGRSRDGETDVVDSDFVPTLAFFHMFSNVDSLYDQIDGGGSSLTWTITGTRESGEPWSFTRDNLFVSEYDISFDSLFEMQQMLFTINDNEFEEVEFTGLDVTESVASESVSYMVDHVLVSRDGVTYEDKKRLKVDRGDLIYVRAVLLPDDGTAELTVDMTVTVPKSDLDSYIDISGGSVYYDDYYYYEEGYGYYFGRNVDTLDELLAALGEQQKNNELRATLRGGRRSKIKSEDLEILDRVVTGSDYVRLKLNNGDEGGKGVVVD